MNLIRSIGFALSLLLIPLFAMQLSDSVKWDVYDFLVAGLILSMGVIGISFINRWFGKSAVKYVLLTLFLLMIILLWVDLAVGIVGTPISGN